MKRIGFLALVLVFVGCGSPDRRLPENVALEKEKEHEKRGSEQIVSSAGGTVTVYDHNNRKNYFTVTWKQAEVNFDIEESIYGGKIQEISGTIVRGEKVQSTFVAREGSVEKGTRLVRLAGGVKVTSTLMDSKLVCNELAYDADTNIIDASKGVEADISGYQIRGIEHLRALGNLDRLGTPDLFNKS